jgi:hypothetical protein
MADTMISDREQCADALPYLTTELSDLDLTPLPPLFSAHVHTPWEYGEMPTSPTSPTSTPFPLNEADVPNLSDLTIKVPPLLDIGELHLGLLSPISQSTVDEAVLQMLQIEDSGDRILGLAKNKLPATNRKRKRDHPPAPNPHRFIDRETEVREYLETNPEGHWSDALSPEQLIACCPNATDDQVISGAFTFCR